MYNNCHEFLNFQLHLILAEVLRNSYIADLKIITVIKIGIGRKVFQLADILIFIHVGIFGEVGQRRNAPADESA